MRKIVLLIGITVALVSCGGSKKAVTTKKPTIPKQVTKVPNTKKEVVVPRVEKKETAPPATYKDKIVLYIANYEEIARHEMETYGIPASITLAQGILESGAGYGMLTKRANNHFGIKCHDWEGESVYHDDDRLQECFRKYDHAGQSFRDHSLFLKNRKRYAKLFTYKQDDYKAWAYGLKAAGYATDKKYPVKLISIIERYNLAKYDREVLSKTKSRAVRKEPTVIKEEVAPPVPVVEKSEEEIQATSRKNSRIQVDTNTEIETEKGKVYVVKKGDTLYSISRKYNIKVAQLKSYNNLTDNTISIGQELIVKPDGDTNEF
ncbi:glucosaminidase domain-containing protein [Aquimarina hainanensis]|uniref:Peptidoglycan hydrolase n=1 Tax=Aquimarina hainanensis TaxID=1578017 RepID=A0ABW5N9Y4_9FLAO|nr:glucosaminidase domain-containing protein [Aquimarina sp. TRL1]QKX03850.1 LysM peptidoglycan-binding domain-containing protein [Aquimarina sp. TRL1]